TGTYTLAQILAPDLSGFDPEPTISGFALSPGDYTLTIAAAVSGDIIHEGITLSLAENQVTTLILSGPLLGSAQLYRLGDTLTLLN
ncbi:MAG: hypothetical protein HY866_18390, partial [Chloroflexi bacterium]|nr:hypothetical protein [Chloroflexota bacterium]